MPSTEKNLLMVADRKDGRGALSLRLLIYLFATAIMIITLIGFLVALL
ncbi:MAG: hypothetical protein JRN52_09045 [Nitrososphaerota archaeon]|nr:hypothetical protein [Nitrososphaerota archaeon]